MFYPFIKLAVPLISNNSLVLVVKRCAGHSKWQNIRHTKAAKDLQRSLVFSKLAQKIRISIQENGNNNNPDSNLRLAHVIEEAKKNYMPAATIQNVIKESEISKSKLKSLWLSVKGPRGSLLLISVLTDNFVKTKNELAVILKKNGGSLVEGSKASFEEKGIIVASPSEDLKNPEEVSIEHAIEIGAEDVKPIEDTNNFMFTCEIQAFLKAKNNKT